MPTGYTADIEKDITFEQFVWRCARAFGALVTMRDDPWDKPIPDRFEPSDYHKNALAKAVARMAELETMTPTQAEKMAAADYALATSERDKRIADNKALLAKYWAMRVQVEAWTPPSEDHVKLKSFMLQQIDESTKFDGMLDYYEQNPIVRLDGAAWLTKQIANTQRDIEYQTKEHAAEVARVNSRNEWLSALRDSLGPECSICRSRHKSDDRHPCE